MHALKTLAVASSLVLASLVLIAVATGCTAQQVQAYNQDVARAKTTYAATTQATEKAVEAEKEAKAVVAELPEGEARAKAVSALAQADAALAKAQEVEKEAGAVLDTAQSVGAALQNGGAPDFSGLAVFGTYGSLAGMILTGAWGLYGAVKNSGLLSKLQTAQAQVDAHRAALGAATGHSDPATVQALVSAGVIQAVAAGVVIPKTLAVPPAEPVKAA